MRRFLEAWKRFGKRVADVQARILLMIFYFVVLCPFALLVRWGSDPLAMKRKSAGGWQPKTDKGEDLMERAARQF
jgi:lipopolysaccharide/colanic/teichoic acid biosynthesis glycosyltransferase